MKKYSILILLLLNFASIWGQKEAANWYFGKFAGLNFNTKIPVPLKGEMKTSEGCASISNRSGRLLFYTDGSTIYNSIGEIMPNGQDLHGGSSSTQSAIIVPKPESDYIYYVFTVNHAEKKSTDEEKFGLNYSVVDMRLQNGYGDVVADSKNTHLITYDVNDKEQADWKCSEKIAATSHSNQKSYWVLTHFIDTFYAFKVDQDGVIHEPVTSKTNEVIDIVNFHTDNSLYTNMSAAGYLKISPDGTKVAIVHSATTTRQSSGKVYLYDFDDNTGKVANNAVTLLNGKYPYGVEFSPKSSKVYVSANNYLIQKDQTTFEGSNLFQFDLLSSNVASTITEIYNSEVHIAGALQLAINGKIYRSKRRTDALFNPGAILGEQSLSAIEKPDLMGNLAAYNHSAVDLAGGTTSENGLPPFISSLFLLTFDYEFTCIGDNTHFFITNDDVYDTIIWDFGDGNTSTEDEPYHKYATPGLYDVTLITSFGEIPNKPIKKTIEIVGEIDILDTPYKLVECDVIGDPEDGITTFNLALANDAISLGKTDEVDIYYYKDLNELENDILNNNSLSPIYTNTEPNELIYAKVVKKFNTCYSVGEVILKGNKSIDFVAETLFGCNLGDGTAQYNLGSHKEIIKDQLGLSGVTIITFHVSSYFASLGYEPLADMYISKPKKIYIRATNEDICYGLGYMQLDMPLMPQINLDETYNICQSSFPIKIDAGVDLTNIQNYTYEWHDGLQTYNTYAIDVSQAGAYYVTITDKLTLCSLVKSININNVIPPIVKKIELTEESGTHTAIVHLENEGDFEYALNNGFGNYQSDPVFTDLAPGSYSVFIRDKDNCNVVEKSFFIFGFLKYFTPNNDGDTDVWEVKGLNPVDFTYSDILIYNRYGKLLASIGPDEFWDGTYNGKFLPSDDYWFTVTVTDKENISTSYTKHFSLIRN